MSRHQRRTARAVEEPANRLLAGNEQVLGFTEAVEESSLAQRVVLGPAWPGSRRVVLLFTTRRLIEIGISATGRRSLGRIRSYPWDGIPAFKIEDRWLEVRTWEDDVDRWFLRELPDPSVEGRLLRRVNLAVSTFVPSQTRTAPLLHCSHCGAERPASEDSCRRCDATLRTARRAGQLALTIPGAGHLYAQRPVAAALRALVELVVFGLLAALVVGTSDVRWIVASVASGLALLGVLKIHSAWSARLLAARSGAISDAAEGRWRRLVPVGLVVSMAVLLAPLVLAGRLDSSVTWDLAFAVSDGTWMEVEAPASGTDRPNPELRALWDHRSGQRVEVSAWPFEPWERAEQTRSRLAVERQITEPARELNGIEVVQATEPVVGGQGSGMVRVSLLAVDASARDVHELSSVVDAADAGAAAARLRDLFERAYWVPPSD